MAFAIGFEKIRNYIFDTAQKKIRKQTRGNYPAPLKILDCIKTGVVQGVEEGYKKEAEVCKINSEIVSYWRVFIFYRFILAFRRTGDDERIASVDVFVFWSN